VVTGSGTLDVVIADDNDFARGIRKTNSGTTTVTAANTFTGQVRVEAGTLALGTGGSFAAASSA
jgi:autotransporter-associated beta strand protein